jgi:hypothetical protein
MKAFLRQHEEDLERYFFNSITVNGCKEKKLDQVMARYVESGERDLTSFFMSLPTCTSFVFNVEHIRDLIEDWAGEPVPDSLAREIGQNWFRILSKTFVKLYTKYSHN